MPCTYLEWFVEHEEEGDPSEDPVTLDEEARASGGAKPWIAFDERVPAGGKRTSLPPPRLMAEEPRAVLSDALSPSWRCSPPPSRRVGTDVGAPSPGAGIGSPSFSLVSPVPLNAA